MTDNPAWDAAVEAAARARYEPVREALGLKLSPPSQVFKARALALERDIQRAFLATAAEQGWRMVPAAVTDDMLMAGDGEIDGEGGRFDHAYTAAVRAAPPFAPERSEVIGGET